MGAQIIEITPERIEQVRGLLAALESGDGALGSELVEEIALWRMPQMFQGLVQITRQLHDSLTSLQQDSWINKMTLEDIPDARDRLSYVISLTEQAANRTLNAVEDSMPLINAMSQRSEKLAGHLGALAEGTTGDGVRDLAQLLKPYLHNVEQDSRKVAQNLNEVVMAQEFQDLTGQLLNRVIRMVRDVEDNLVGLIKSTTGLNPAEERAAREASGIHAEGPHLPDADVAHVVKGQDEVDDLLASLGF